MEKHIKQKTSIQLNDFFNYLKLFKMKKLLLICLLFYSLAVLAQDTCVVFVNGTYTLSPEPSQFNSNAQIPTFNCLEDAVLDLSCVAGNQNYLLGIDEFDLMLWKRTKTFMYEYVNTTIPSTLNISELIPPNYPTCGKVYQVTFDGDPTVWNPHSMWFKIDCSTIAEEESYACTENLQLNSNTLDVAYDQLLLHDGTKVIAGYTQNGITVELFIEELDNNGVSIRKKKYPIIDSNDSAPVSNVKIINDIATNEYVLFFDTKVAPNNSDVFILKVNASTLVANPNGFEGPVVVDLGNETAVDIENNLLGEYILLVNQHNGAARDAYVVKYDGSDFNSNKIEIGNPSWPVYAHDLMETGRTIGDYGCLNGQLNFYGNSYLIGGSVGNNAFVTVADCNGFIITDATVFDADQNTSTNDKVKRIEYFDDKFYLAGESVYGLLNDKIWLAEFTFGEITLPTFELASNLNWLKLYSKSNFTNTSIVDMHLSDDFIYITGETASSQVAFGTPATKNAYIAKLDLSGNIVWNNFYNPFVSAPDYKQTKINDIIVKCGAVNGIGNTNEYYSDFVIDPFIGPITVYYPTNRFIYKLKATLNGSLLEESCTSENVFSVVTNNPAITDGFNLASANSLATVSYSANTLDLTCESECCSDVDLLLSCNTVCNPTDSLVITSGWDGNSALIPCAVNNIDPHWKLINNPLLYSCGSALVPADGNAYLGSAGLTGLVGATTIVPYNSGCGINFSCSNPLNANNEPIPYVFERTFCVCDSDLVSIDLVVKADDHVFVELLNVVSGLPIVTSPVFPLAFPGPVNWTQNLSAGSYAIRVHLKNTLPTELGFSLKGAITSATNSNTIIGDSLCCQNNTINVRKVLDNNCNGTFELGDQVGPGWTFELYDASGTTLLQTATTDVNGELFFNYLDDGTYVVQEVSQSGYSSVGSSTRTITISSGSFNVLEFYNCKSCDIASTYNYLGGDSCCFQLDISNNLALNNAAKLEIEILTPNVFFENGSVFANGGFNLQSNAQNLLEIDANPLNLTPPPYLPTGFTGNYVEFCLGNSSSTNISPQVFKITYFDQNCDSLECTQIDSLDCDLPPSDMPCLEIYDIVVECDSLNPNKFIINYTVENLSSDLILDEVVFWPINPSPVIFAPSINPIVSPIGPGGIAYNQSVCLIDFDTAPYPKQLDFWLSANGTNINSQNDDCCHDPTYIYSVTLPNCCDPCDTTWVSVDNVSVPNNGECCYNLDILNTCDSLLSEIKVESITPGFTLGFLSNQDPGNWNFAQPNSTTAIWSPANGNYANQGNYIDLINFCLDSLGSGINPQIRVSYIYKDASGIVDSVYCEEIFDLDCDVNTACIDVVDYDVFCDSLDNYFVNICVENVSAPAFSADGIRVDATSLTTGKFFGVNPFLINSPIISTPFNPTDIVCFTTGIFGSPSATVGDMLKLELKMFSGTNPMSPDTCCYESDSIFITLPPCCEEVELVVDGDFNDNTGASFTSNIPQNCNCVAGSWCIDTDVTNKCWNNSITAPPGCSPNLYIVDGAQGNVWSQNVTITPATDYLFSFYYFPDISDGGQPQLDININGTNLIGSTTGASGIWSKSSFAWNSGTISGTFPLNITQANTVQFSDYAIDHVSFSSVCDTCDLVSASYTSVLNGNDPDQCCFEIDLINNFQGGYFDAIQTEIISGGNTVFGTKQNDANWTFNDSAPFSQTHLEWTPNSGSIPIGMSQLPPICFGNVLNPADAPQTVVVSWMQNGSVVCTDTLTFNCTETQPCITVDSILVTCNPNDPTVYNLAIELCNQSGLTLYDFDIYSVLPSSITVNPTYVVFPSLANGNCTTLNYQITGGNAGDFVSLGSHSHDAINASYCCVLEPIEFTLPPCSSCCEGTLQEFCEDHIDPGFVVTNSNSPCYTISVDPVALDDCMQVTYYWGDGTSSGPFVGNTANITHTYPGSGNYFVCMYVQEFDDAGNICWEKEYCNEVYVPECNYCDNSCIGNVDFNVTPSSGAYAYTFTSPNVTSNFCSSIVSVDWTIYANPTVSTTVLSPTVTFPGSGMYSATLIIYFIDAAGNLCEAGISKQFYVSGSIISPGPHFPLPTVCVDPTFTIGNFPIGSNYIVVDQYIHSQAIVGPIQNVELKAGDYVELQIGTVVEQGAEFNAEIEQCTD